MTGDISDLDDKTVTKEELARYLHNEQNMPLSVCQEIVDRFFVHARTSILENKKLLLTNFGSFKILDKPERPGRNFKDNRPTKIAARSVVRFSSAAKLRQELNLDAPAILHGEQKNVPLVEPGKFHSAMTQFLGDKAKVTPVEQVLHTSEKKVNNDTTIPSILPRVDNLLSKLYSEKEYINRLLG